MRVERNVYEKYLKSYIPGTVIFEEGDPGNEMYVIIQGEVEIRKRTSATTSKTLIVFHKGDIFGEMAIIEKKPRSASAIVTQHTKILVMNEYLLESTIETNPDFAKKMIRILSERLRRANSIIQSITVTDQQNQIMYGLFQYAKENGTSTFKGYRVNIEQFVKWAQDHLGFRDKDIQFTVQAFLKRGIVKPSAVGKEEIIVEPRNRVIS